MARNISSCNNNDNSSNNECSYNSSQTLSLIHLPNEILSKVILELLNEWCLIKSMSNRYMRGLLDNSQTPPELATDRMIPLSQVNKFFHEIVWTVTLKYSYWNQNPYEVEGYVWGMIFSRVRPFVFTKNMLQSRGIEPVNEFYIKGPICQEQLKFVHKLSLENMPFLVSSVGTGLHRTFEVPILKFLTTLSLSTYFIINSASKYKRLEEQFPDYWMRSHEKSKDLRIELPPFVEAEMKNQISDKAAIKERIIAYYELLICKAIAKMISLLDHPVDCTISHFLATNREIEIVLWSFEKANIISHIKVLNVFFQSSAIISNECTKILAALNLKQIFLLCDKNEVLTKKLTSLLIENKTALRAVYHKNEHAANLSFPDNLELLSTQCHLFFSELNAPLSQRFTRLIELALDFQSQIHQKFIKKSLLHFPALQTFTISGKVDINIGLIRCILESNPTVTAVSIYYQGFYENLDSLYQSLSHVKLLNISYQNQFQGHHTLKFNLKSLLDVILRNTRSLEIIMIHQSSKTKPLSFSNFATKLACQHKQNTQHLRYIYIYNSTRDDKMPTKQNLVSIFFNNYKIDRSKLSPYNPAIKRLYRIDGVLWGNEVDTRRCRLEMDVLGIRRLMNSSKSDKRG
jgi:hypothetical protein